MLSRERRAGELSVFGPSSNPMMAACDCDVVPVRKLVSYITAIAPKSLRISTWAGAGQTYECVAYAAKLEVAVGLRLGHKRQAFWIASVFTVASFFGISFTARLPSRGVRGPPRAVFADLGGPSCKAAFAI